MSFAKIIPGVAVLGAAVVAAGTAALQAVLPHPAPIIMHRLSYDAPGMVTQYRTVNGEGEVRLMSWAAQVVDTSTDRPVRGCTGSGSWPYETGRLEAVLPLSEWVGSAACQPSALLPGEYRLRAVYSVDGEQVTASSAPFRIGG